MAIVKATAGVVGENARAITNNFYGRMFTANPEVLAFFNKANQKEGRQQQALANAIIAYGANIDNLGALGPAVGLMATKHCGLQVLPEHYGIVHDNLMASVAEVLGAAVTPEIGAAWSEAVMSLAGILIGEEEKLYKAAESKSGGWRGWKNFAISDITQCTSNVKTFTFKPEVENTNGGFSFVAGQYLSVQVDPFKDGSLTAPRHYTITSRPGEDYFQITTKRLDKGVVSGYMHDSLKVGDVVKLSPPFGNFNVPEDSSPIVCVSAGIGMTPMKIFCEAHADRVAKVVHVDKTAEDVPFKEFFQSKFSDKTSFHYSGPAGKHPSADELIAVMKAGAADNTRYFVCGPTMFMCEVAKALRASGVSADNVVWEAFAPSLSCPVL